MPHVRVMVLRAQAARAGAVGDLLKVTDTEETDSARKAVRRVNRTRR
jgi:hypothetical protein